eukprot:6471629-Amphidinium_carterae.1
MVTVICPARTQDKGSTVGTKTRTIFRNMTALLSSPFREQPSPSAKQQQKEWASIIVERHGARGAFILRLVFFWTRMMCQSNSKCLCQTAEKVGLLWRKYLLSTRHQGTAFLYAAHCSHNCNRNKRIPVGGDHLSDSFKALADAGRGTSLGSQVTGHKVMPEVPDHRATIIMLSLHSHLALLDVIYAEIHAKAMRSHKGVDCVTPPLLW